MGCPTVHITVWGDVATLPMPKAWLCWDRASGSLLGTSGEPRRRKTGRLKESLFETDRVNFFIVPVPGFLSVVPQ